MVRVYPDVVGPVCEVFRVDQGVYHRRHLDFPHGPAFLGVREARAPALEDVLHVVGLVWLGKDIAEAGCLRGVAVYVDGQLRVISV